MLLLPALIPPALVGRSALAASGPLVTNPGDVLTFRRADVGQAIASLPEPGGLVLLVAGCVLLAALEPRKAGSAFGFSRPTNRGNS